MAKAFHLFTDTPHRRYNPLTGEWILVSPHRTKRPWAGQKETPLLEKRLQYDPGCYLCPGNKRANGETNPNYINPFVFQNDFSALLSKVPTVINKDTSPLMRSHIVSGECHVICFSPRHDLTLAEMSAKDIEQVFRTWQKITKTLGQKNRWVQIFENKGAIMGCSNPHPHGQVWAGDALPNEPAKEDKNQNNYFNGQQRILLQDYLELETKENKRIVIENTDWTVLVPFWAIWPFETMLLPKRHILRLPDMSENEIRNGAIIVKQLLTRYDNLFQISFPYTMGWHGAPTDSGNYNHWQLHAHFYPPLLRSSSVKKFMVGYEMLAEPQRDITPEQAAEKLISLSDFHWNENV